MLPCAQMAIDAVERWRDSMDAMNIVLWTGGDAPTRDATLTVTVSYSKGFAAFYEPGFCGCPDCHPILGRGATAGEAIADYWEQWEERQ